MKKQWREEVRGPRLNLDCLNSGNVNVFEWKLSANLELVCESSSHVDPTSTAWVHLCNSINTCWGTDDCRGFDFLLEARSKSKRFSFSVCLSAQQTESPSPALQVWGQFLRDICPFLKTLGTINYVDRELKKQFQCLLTVLAEGNLFETSVAIVYRGILNK